MRYEGTVYRPPGEWKSYLLQCTMGCSYNKCTFCEAYKGRSFRIRPLEQALEDIELAGFYHRDTETVFICDGDAIILPTDYLLTVIGALHRTFPRLRRITCYAGAISTASKTDEELKALHDAGLGRVYLGVETGDDELLRAVEKGVTARETLEAGLRLKSAGFDLWVTVIAGLEGGGDRYIRNAELTAQLLNALEPQHLSVMTYMPTEGTQRCREMLAGTPPLQTPRQSLLETRLLLSRLKLKNTHFTANHPSNILPLKGTIDRDTEKLIALLDEEIPKAPDVADGHVWLHG